MTKKYAALYTDQKLKKNKIWQDGVLVLTPLSIKQHHNLVLLSSGNQTITTHRVDPILVYAQQTIDMGSHFVQIESEMVQSEQGPKCSNYVQYRIGSGNWLEGSVEFDGKSLAVFKAADGKQLLRRVCGGVVEGQTVQSANILIQIQGPTQSVEPPVQTLEKRKTMVCKTAVAQVQSYPQPKLQAQASGANKTITIIYTEDKHKKNQKKWLDGTLKLSTAGMGVIEGSDSQTICKKNFTDPSVLTDGYEFEGGRFQFMITDPTLTVDSAKGPELKKRKTMVKPKSPIFSTNDFKTASLTSPNVDRDENRQPKNFGDSLLELFDD